MASEGFSSHTLYAQLVSTAHTHEHESELYELAQLAGVTMDPEVFNIVLDFLEMKCSPKTIADVIHSMVKHNVPDTDELRDIGQGEPAHHMTLPSKNISSHGPTPSVRSSHSPLRGPTSASKSYRSGRSNASSDQSRFSNITTRSNSGERQSRSSGSHMSGNASSSRLHSLHDTSSPYLGLSRGEHKGRSK